MILTHRSRPQLGFVLVPLASCLLSCFASPETCHDCRPGQRDAAEDSGDAGTGAGGTFAGSGGIVGGGGSQGTGGVTATGGMTNLGGATGSGGNLGSGGVAPTGGRGGGGAIGSGGASGSGGVGGGGGSAGAKGGGGAGGSSATGGAASGGRGGGSGGASGGASGAAGAAGGRGGNGGTASPNDPDLVVWYKFDEASGMTAGDSAMFGGTTRNGTLTNVSTGTATFSTMAKVGSHSLTLAGSSGTVGAYVSTPTLQPIAPNAVTIACWVYLTKDQNWQRLFDFGKTPAPVTGGTPNPLIYMFLTMHQGTSTPASLRFSITTMGNTMEQQINMTTPAVPTLNAWHHVAVTLAAGATYTGTLYVDHAVAGTNTAMTLHPTDLGVTEQNFIGKSQFASDAYLGAMVDDFRVYRRALTTAEIAALP